MKKIIRTGVFETNSSSSHSVSIADSTKPFILETIVPDEDGVITLTGGEYGWDYFKSNDPQEKADYAAQQFMYDQDALDLLIDVILEVTGAKRVVIADLNHGYVDHDSVGIIKADKDELRQLIFNKNSWIFGGNDNSEPDPTFYDVPEYTVDGVMEVKYKYKLKIDGLENETFFKSYPSEDEITQGIHSLIDDFKLDSYGDFDTDTSIFHKLERSRSACYELNYRRPIDMDKMIIPFVREDTWSIANHMFKENELNKDVNWSPDGYNMVRSIEESLITMLHSPYVIYKSFEIIEIDDNQ